ncbi:MAG TPA: AAA family ATPase, partial [Candidatus Binataceae bacterium]|nr:AAA family ATPase [Candidatus Binataceae bacterium]
MKDYLFIDNFRGFTDTCFPVTDVNFLVGENSTGKTSVLGLIKLFTGPRFLMEQRADFADEHVSFGHFADMVSAHSAERKQFHIGLVRERPKRKDEEQRVGGWLCTFREDKGRPRLSNYTFSEGSKKISLRYNRDQIRYK